MSSLNTKKKAVTSSSRQHPCLVAAVGASAGGLEAFQQFFSHIKFETKIAFVLLQHLDPDHGTRMPELLAGSTSLPIITVDDSVTIEPDHIYVLPPKSLLSIKNGTLTRVDAEDSQATRQCIDEFLVKLAEDQNHNAVAIILSGAGSDGMVGIRSIKRNGGMVIVQDPRTARFDHMPMNAISTGLADHVLAIEEMPERLIQYSRLLSVLYDEKCLDRISQDATHHLPEIFKALLEKTGHDFSRYKRSTIIRRLRRRMQVTQCATVTEYLKRLAQEPHEISNLFKDILIGVTRFFRDPDAFESLRKKVIPKLFENKDRDDHVRVWVPACATGEEAYSLAILLRQYAETLASPPPIQVFATDIDHRALEVARQGRYKESLAEEMEPELLAKYFTREGADYRVVKELRDICIFSVHNIVKDPPFSRLDLISCRNLLIYMESDLQKKVIPLFHHSLRENGYLFLGPSESVASHPDLFQALDKKERVFKRRTVLVRPHIDFPLMEPLVTPRPTAIPNISPGGGAQTVGLAAQRVLLENYSPPSVIINEQSDIVYFSGRTGRYLEPPAGTPSLNVMDMAHRSLRLVLRTSIHRAITKKESVIHRELAVELDGQIQKLNLIVRPLVELGENSNLFMVIFHEIGGPVSARQAEAEGVHPNPEDTVALQLESELRKVKERLQTTIEELETSNEELKSSNEELLSMNEELQSANEELRASEEELRVANERLEQNVVELNNLNSDLQNLFQNTSIATLFLDRELRIKRFTPAATDIFHLIASDVGRPITDISSRVPINNLKAEIQECLHSLQSVEREVEKAPHDRIYRMRVTPYRDHDNIVVGAVMTFVDVTDLKRAQHEIKGSEQHLRRVLDTLTVFVGVMSPDGTLLEANQPALDVAGVRREDVVGKPIWDTYWWTYSEEAQNQLKDSVTRAASGETVRHDAVIRVATDTFITIDFSISPMIDTRGEVSHLIPSGIDVTSRVNQRTSDLQAMNDRLVREAEEKSRAEKALGEQWVLLHGILNQALHGIAACDKDGVTTFFNPAAERIMRVSSAVGERIGSAFFGTVHDSGGNPLAPDQLVIERALRGEETVHEEMTIVRPDGTRYEMVISAAPLKMDNDIIGAVAVFADVTERNAQLRQLDEQRAMLEAVFEQAADGIAYSDLDGNYLLFNHAARAIAGVPDDVEPTFSSEYWGEAYTTDGRNLRPEEWFINRATCGEKVTGAEVRMVRNDRSYYDLSISCSPLRRDNGEVFGAVMMFSDITERRAVQEELQRSYAEMERRVKDRTRDLAKALEDNSRNFAQLELILNNIRQGVIICDGDANVIRMNQAAIDFHEFDSEELSNKPLSHYAQIIELRDESGRVLAPEDWVMARVLRGETVQPFEERMKRLDTGHERIAFVGGQPVCDDSGNVILGVVAMMDVTESRRAEQAFRLHRERFDLVIQSVDIGVWYCNLPFGKLEWDKKAKEHFWLPPDAEVTFDTFLERLHPDDREIAHDTIQKTIETQSIYDVEYRTTNPLDDRFKWIRSIGRVFYSEDGAPLRFDGITIDTTARRRAEDERRRLETQFQQAQKMESLGVLAGGIAHDFNNLLVGILGNASMAIEETGPSSKSFDYIQGIETASRRAAELCRQMLAYSGKGRFFIEPININELVSEMGDLLQSSISKKAFLNMQLAANLPTIEADATQLRQIVMNLITNASEALQEKSGSITITTGVTYCDREFLGSALIDEYIPEGNYVFIEVTDTGVGMDEETASRIFDPFFTTKFTGRGLGLAAVLGIVRGHKGAMRVFSELGRGTTFTVYLPAHQIVPDPVAKTPQELPEFQGGGTVMLVDDSETVRAVGSRMLENAGLTVLLAEDGLAAVELFRKHSEDIDCIVLDLTMPRMDGHEAYVEIRRISADVPVILSSGYNEQEAVNLFTGKGLSAFVQKPYHSVELIGAVQRAISERRGSK